MNVLILEDESRVTRVLCDAIQAIVGGRVWAATVRVVEDRDSALQLLRDPGFPVDVAVLDLHVPAGPHSGPGDPAFGLDVLHAIRSVSAGTKLVVFSGRAGGASTTVLLDAAWTADPLGLGSQESMLEFVPKENLDECVTRIVRYGDELAVVESIDVSFGLERFALDRLDKRTLQVCARRLAARGVRISKLGGGLSGQLTLRVQVYRGGVQPIASLVAKVGPLDVIDKEYIAYSTHVAPRLGLGCFPQYADRVDAGAAGRGAVFFRLADQYDRSLGEAVRDDPAIGQALIATLREKTSGWHESRTRRSLVVRDIRRMLVSDQDLGEAAGSALNRIPWRDVEDIAVDVNVCSQHGDLHFLNVLSTQQHDLVIIDFARAGDAPASVDPLTLELSLSCHPDCSTLTGGTWPSLEQLARWWDLSAYLVHCPFPGFVRECRAWAYDVAASDSEVAAVVYGYGMRHLRWPDSVDQGRALVDGALLELTSGQ